MKNKLSGIFAPVNTPFLSNEEVDFEGFGENLKYYSDSQLDGLLLLGSNSEYKSLGENEKQEILNLATKVVGNQKIIIVGLMYDSLYLVKKFIRNICNLHIDYLLVQPPFYFRTKFTDNDYFQYYEEITKISPVPILIYNAPGFTGVDFSEKIIDQLAKFKQIVGIKDSSKIKKQYPNKLSVLSGTVNTLLEMLENNAVGGVVSIANYIPDLPIQIYTEYNYGNFEKAKYLQEVAIKINNSVSGTNGVAGVKAAMDSVGLTGGHLREPLHRLLPLEIEKIENLIKEYIKWEGKS